MKARPPVARLELTARERDVLRCAADGLDRRGTGRRLFLSDGTVAWYRKSINQKLGAATMAHAVAIAYERELFVPQRPPDIVIFGETRYVRDATASAVAARQP